MCFRNYILIVFDLIITFHFNFNDLFSIYIGTVCCVFHTPSLLTICRFILSSTTLTPLLLQGGQVGEQSLVVEALQAQKMDRPWVCRSH